ncbi:development-specific protein LVN1.2-like [Acanthaster planci]|uniref:Development-specific protein LVN1.2-like n=1 Tax=Acanthaster planci TaxID=133434 RepID=A0A8B7ZG35_ACAPL|nr:development-specific protein LVN1.2-like [Acanthaster planci]
MGLKSVAFVLFVVVAASYAKSLANVKPCCYPDKYEISSGTQAGLSRNGRGTGYSIQSVSAVDATAMKIGEKGIFFEEDGTAHEFRNIKDYAKKEEYRIDPKGEQCEVEPLEEDMPLCVPENATFSDSSYLGNDSLIVDSYIYFYNYPGYVVGHQSVGVAKEGCIPTSYTFSGSLGKGRRRTDILTITGFYNYKDGISDEASFFDVPGYCETSVNKNAELWELLRYKQVPIHF